MAAPSLEQYFIRRQAPISCRALYAKPINRKLVQQRSIHPAVRLFNAKQGTFRWPLVMPKQRKQDDDRERHSQEPKQRASSKTHCSLLFLSGSKRYAAIRVAELANL